MSKIPFYDPFCKRGRKNISLVEMMYVFKGTELSLKLELSEKFQLFTRFLWEELIMLGSWKAHFLWNKAILVRKTAFFTHIYITRFTQNRDMTPQKWLLAGLCSRKCHYKHNLSVFERERDHLENGHTSSEAAKLFYTCAILSAVNNWLTSCFADICRQKWQKGAPLSRVFIILLLYRSQLFVYWKRKERKRCFQVLLFRCFYYWCH